MIGEAGRGEGVGVFEEGGEVGVEGGGPGGVGALIEAKGGEPEALGGFWVGGCEDLAEGLEGKLSVFVAGEEKRALGGREGFFLEVLVEGGAGEGVPVGGFLGLSEGSEAGVGEGVGGIWGGQEGLGDGVEEPGVAFGVSQPAWAVGGEEGDEV